MTIYLVRHAHAGERRTWEGDDRYRPLSLRGQIQSTALLPTFHRARFARIVSSPSVRCVETVVPLAVAHGMAIEIDGALFEGPSIDGALELVAKYAPEGAVFASHGDIIPMLLHHWADAGLDLGPEPRCQKASVWVIDTDVDGEPTGARYIPPPAAEAPKSV